MGQNGLQAETIVEAGIDYLAMSLREAHEGFQSWLNNAEHAVSLLAEHGNVPRVGMFRGYSGVWCGGAFVGEKEGEGFLSIPGAWAGKLWAQTYHPKAHYSRLDMQVTVKYAQFDTMLSKKAYDLAIALNEERPLKQRRKLRLIADSEGGSTLYIGSRKSEHFCRLYNKYAATNDPYYADCWRYEVELHNDSATAASTYLYEGARSQPRAVSSTVWRYFTERGVLAPWARESEENALLPRSAPRSDIERKLAWLTEQVSPTVHLLLKHLPDTLVFQALGIGPDAEPLPVEGRADDGGS